MTKLKFLKNIEGLNYFKEQLHDQIEVDKWLKPNWNSEKVGGRNFF